MSQSGIYIIRHIESGKVYVGSATNIQNRWAVHRKALRSGKHHSAKLQNAWNKYGEAEFSFEIIEFVSVECLIEREQFHMDSLRAAGRSDGYNVSAVAGSPRGVKHSEEFRRTVSERFRGKKQSAEHLANRSAALKGRRPADATIAASVAYWTGRKHSVEHREKVSEKLRGRTLVGAHLEAVRNGAKKRRAFSDEIESSVLADRAAGMTTRALAEKYGCSEMPIRRVLRGM